MKNHSNFHPNEVNAICVHLRSSAVPELFNVLNQVETRYKMSSRNRDTASAVKLPAYRNQYYLNISHICSFPNPKSKI